MTRSPLLLCADAFDEMLPAVWRDFEDAGFTYPSKVKELIEEYALDDAELSQIRAHWLETARHNIWRGLKLRNAVASRLALPEEQKKSPSSFMIEMAKRSESQQKKLSLRPYAEPVEPVLIRLAQGAAGSSLKNSEDELWQTESQSESVVGDSKYRARILGVCIDALEGALRREMMWEHSQEIHNGFPVISIFDDFRGVRSFLYVDQLQPSLSAGILNLLFSFSRSRSSFKDNGPHTDQLANWEIDAFLPQSRRYLIFNQLNDVAHGMNAVATLSRILRNRFGEALASM